MMKIGVIADIHGDLDSFKTALDLLSDVDQILCAGDIVDRGSGADEIVQLIKQHNIACIKGNHDYTVVENQAKWRTSNNPERMAELGRIISDETVAFLQSLPDVALFRFEKKRILMAHGVPWSDVMGLFPTTRQSIFDRVVERYKDIADVLILGHTHHPMQVNHNGMWIFNPGSIYGTTQRDSHTCAVLSLPGLEFEVYDL